MVVSVSASPRVSVVIPAWNSVTQLKRNLPAVFTAASRVQAELLIIDDASQDHSTAYLRSLGSQIRFYQNKSNRGFAYTANRGVKLAQGQYVILLNTDVRPAPTCFVKALAYFQDPTVYAVTFNSNESWAGGHWRRGLFEHFPIFAAKTQRQRPSPSLWASGGQAAFDRAKWLQLGGFDLLYKPFYWEDVDLGYRAWKRGWRILWAPDCRCVHDHSKSVIANNFTPEFIRTTAQRNQFLFVWKNISDPLMLCSHLLRLPFFFYSYPKPLWRAFRLLPLVWQARRRNRSLPLLSDRQVLRHWSQDALSGVF